MILNLSNLTIQTLSWIMAFVTLSLGFYLFILDSKSFTNRLVFFTLAVIAFHQAFEGLLAGASGLADGFAPSIVLSITPLVIMPAMVLLTVQLLKPMWRKERWKALVIIQWGVIILVILPVLITLADVLLTTRFPRIPSLHYSRLDLDYSGGFVAWAQYTGGVLAPLLKITNLVIPYFLVMVICFYVAVMDQEMNPSSKRLAWFLFFIAGMAGAFQLILHITQADGGFAGSFFLVALGYGFADTRQMETENRLPRGNLKIRMTLLFLAITAPLLFAMILVIISQSNVLFEQRAIEILKSVNQVTSSYTRAWLENKELTLQRAAAMPEVKSMVAGLQKPVLKALTAVHQELFLASIIDPSGKEVVRSDEQSPRDYASTPWFQRAIESREAVVEIFSDPLLDQTELIVAVPIWGENNQLVGIVLSASATSEFMEGFLRENWLDPIADTGYVYIVDEHAHLIAHSDPTYTGNLGDPSTHFPITALREGMQGFLRFADDQGVSWCAYVSRIENGWGIIAQQREDEIFSPLRRLQQVSFGLGIAGLILLGGMVWLMVRKSLHPISSLLETASAISEGDLSRQAPIESEDELGFLAEKFNRMTWQLNEAISSLEMRVKERTSDLERRSNQLKAATLVSKEAAGIRDIQQMLNQTVHLISNYFGFYHTGIFILDEVREYAVLQAANSEGGQRMLARGHKLRVGQVGIVGYVADVGVPRIALNVGEDAVFFNNPDLPLTRSEMALPLKARGQVIGVLDVQSIEEGAFTVDDVDTLQVLADQVALALDNARLIKESRDALEELRNLYGQRTWQAWKERLDRGSLAYRYSRTGLLSGGESDHLDTFGGGSIDRVSEPLIRIKDGQQEMLIPIILRGQVLGSLVLRREREQNPWSQGELKIAMEMISQVLPALENARLLEEIRNRAQMEAIASQVSSKIQSSLDLETVLKTAVQEIGLIVNASRVEIQMLNSEDGFLQTGQPNPEG